MANRSKRFGGRKFSFTPQTHPNCSKVPNKLAFGEKFSDPRVGPLRGDLNFFFPYGDFLGYAVRAARQTLASVLWGRRRNAGPCVCVAGGRDDFTVRLYIFWSDLLEKNINVVFVEQRMDFVPQSASTLVPRCRLIMIFKWTKINKHYITYFNFFTKTNCFFTVLLISRKFNFLVKSNNKSL